MRYGDVRIHSAYAARGWTQLIPLSPADKVPLVDGRHGGAAVALDDDARQQLMSDHPTANVGIVLPPGVVGVDVDDHSGKPGGATLAAMEAAYGRLPATWRSSARPAPSGVLLFRVPDDLPLRHVESWIKDRFGVDGERGRVSGIDIIRREHRYVQCYPSVHVKAGDRVMWHDRDGAPVRSSAGFPTLSQLPWWPEPWLAAVRAAAEGLDAAWTPPSTVAAIPAAGRAPATPGGAMARLYQLADQLARTGDGDVMCGAEMANRLPFWAGGLVRFNGLDEAEVVAVLCGALDGWQFLGSPRRAVERRIAAAVRNGAVSCRRGWEERDTAWGDFEDPDEDAVTALDAAGAAMAAPALADELEADDPPGPEVPRPVKQWINPNRAGADEGSTEPAKTKNGKAGKVKAAPGADDARWSEAGMVDTVAEWLGDDFRWCPEFGWMGWTGTHWERGVGKGSDAGVAAREIARQRVLEANLSIARRLAAHKGVPDPEQEMIGRMMGDLKVINRIVESTRGKLRVEGAAFNDNASRWLLNTPDGTIDLRKGADRTPREHARGDHLTGVTRYGVGAQVGPAWSAFLERVLPDAQVRRYVQRWLGVSLVGEVLDHLFVIMDGVGRNGKGTLRSAILNTLGPDYSCEVDPKMIMMSAHREHRTFLMRLWGRRVVFTSETEEGAKLNNTFVKRLSGNDPVEANYMHKDPIEWMPYHHLNLMTNDLPEVSGVSFALWERIRRVLFEVVIPEAERDPALNERLATQGEGRGIMRWLLDGLDDYWAVGLGTETTPEPVKLATANYQGDSDIGASFLATCTEPARTEAEWSSADALFEAWRRFAARNGVETGTSTTFGRDLGKRGIGKRRVERGNVYAVRILHGEPDGMAADDPRGELADDPWADTGAPH